MASSEVPKNVARLLLRRELGMERPGYCIKGLERGSVGRQLEAWREGDFLRNCTADYASFQPAPRSTIALCYNSDGSLLASTHGDHTVKITSCPSGTLSRILTGHRRTPWVVRFHPRNATLLASGSLDHEVRLWDAASGQCLAKHTFGKPIASLAFHISVPVLAIACGHKLYMWEYTVPGATPIIVLKTRRSMRAVHFHPFGLPVVLTAEVQDPTHTEDLQETLTEDKSFLDSSHLRGGSSASPHLSSPFPMLPLDASLPCLPPSLVPLGREVPFPSLIQPMQMAGNLPAGESSNNGNYSAQLAVAINASMWNLIGEEQPPRVRLRLFNFNASKPSVEFDEQADLRLEVSDAVLCSEMGVHFSPCGKFLAATIACKGPILPLSGVAPQQQQQQQQRHQEEVVGVIPREEDESSVSPEMEWEPSANNHHLRNVITTPGMATRDPMAYVAQPAVNNGVGRESTMPLSHPSPSTPSAPQTNYNNSNGNDNNNNNNNNTLLGGVPPAHRVVFEVRIMSLDGSAMGDVVKARRVRAAHCLTSVQFSPSGNHLLLAYGKKHSSLLRSLVMDRGTLMPLHTILEVMALKDMNLVRVLPSVEDEINAACFHPLPGGGLAYGTKEGRLRMITGNRNLVDNDNGTNPEDKGNDHQSGNDLPEMVLLEQGWMLLQQQFERDSETLDRMRRDRAAVGTRQQPTDTQQAQVQ